jgi:hypothetical protein
MPTLNVKLSLIGWFESASANKSVVRAIPSSTETPEWLPDIHEGPPNLAYLHRSPEISNEPENYRRLYYGKRDFPSFDEPFRGNRNHRRLLDTHCTVGSLIVYSAQILTLECVDRGSQTLARIDQLLPSSSAAHDEMVEILLFVDHRPLQNRTIALCNTI